MIDIALNPAGDIAITNLGFQTVSGVDQIAQNLAIRLRFMLGEYYLNTLVGIPYYQEIFVKPANQIRVDSIFKNEILDTVGVLELTKYSAEVNSSSREYTINFSVRTITGETIDQELELTI
jgi:hypothetical protein